MDNLLYKVEFRIVRLVEAESAKDAIEVAWGEVYDNSRLGDPPTRCSSEVSQVEVNDKDWEKYCNGEEIPQCNIPYKSK